MMLNRKKPFILLALCIFILGAFAQKVCARDSGGTHETDTHPAIKFYQKHISGIDGNRCPMYPSCSGYGAQAIQKHGLLLGWIMACDRLLRCGKDEVRLSPHIKINGRELTFDPVSANDFWWFSPQTTSNDTDVPIKHPDQSGFVPMPDVVKPEHLK